MAIEGRWGDIRSYREGRGLLGEAMDGDLGDSREAEAEADAGPPPGV
jgi:hypothetical protein